MSRPLLAPPRVSARSSGNATILAAEAPLADPGRCVGDWLARWAREAPTRTLVAERDADGRWRRLAYADAWADARGLGSALLELGASPSAPVMVLADNGIDHARVALAAMQVGVPVAPVSTAYASHTSAFERLRAVATQLGPSIVYVEDRDRYASALAAIEATDNVVTARDLDGLARRPVSAAAERAFEAIGPATPAKILFTSGSTGWPKGVVNTQRMLCSNQQAIAQTWPFVDDGAPVLLDWLPWSHTFGGNHNFFMVLRNGGTLYVDDGRPAPHLIGKTLANLRDISPTIYLNVPRGYEQMLPHLEADPSLQRALFERVALLFYAAAALPPVLWERLERVAAAVGRTDVVFTSAWGSTETAPLATSAHYPYRTVGNIGVPVPGTEIKLAPVDDKLELRVRGPNVTPGYWQPGGEIEPVHLDEDGFLSTGDAGRLEHPDRPEAGLLFEGRLGENFKLRSGTWVGVGRLRIAIVDACSPHVADAVVAGHDQDFVALLLFVTAEADPRAIRAALEAWNDRHPASSERIARALVLAEPPSLDAGETTDKGYLNQRRILERRANDVARLFSRPPDAAVMVLPGAEQ